MYAALKIITGEDLLLDYHEEIVVEFFKYGWLINYSANQLPHSTMHTNPSALAFDHVRHPGRIVFR